jgi:hypothetical protein
VATIQATAKPAATSEGIEDCREIEIKQAKKAPMQAIPAPVVKPTVEPSIPAAQRSLKVAVPVAQSAPLSGGSGALWVIQGDIGSRDTHVVLHCLIVAGGVFPNIPPLLCDSLVVTPEAAKLTEAAVGGVEAVVVEPRRNAAVKEAQRAQSPQPSAAAAVVNAAAKPAMPSIKSAPAGEVMRLSWFWF